MSIGEQGQESSLRDSIAGAMGDGGAGAPPGAGAPQPGAAQGSAAPAGAPPGAGGVAPPPTEFQIPQKWPKQLQDAAKAMLGLPNNQGRPWVESVHSHWREQQGSLTRLEQERAALRDQWNPIRQVIEPYAHRWQMQGMDTQQGLRMLLTWADQLSQKPQEVIPRLAELYGIDLKSLVADQPYVDPTVSALQREVQQLRQAHQMGQLSQVQERQQSALEQLRSFETATDEQGNPKFQHFPRLMESMTKLVASGMANSLEDAYAKAIRFDDELQSEIAKQKAEQDAAARAAEAKRAVEASRTVRAKGTRENVPQKSLREDLLAQFPS
jgi:hypothetical protein